MLITLTACAAATPRAGAGLSEPRASHSASLLADGTILVAGGFRKAADGHSQLYTATTELVDATGHTRPGPALGEARAGHVAVTLSDGRILVAGGWNESGMLRTAEVYDPARARFTRVGDLVEPRGGATATVLADGRVLVCGGGDRVATHTAELFDPRDARFHATGDLVTARLGHAATLLRDGRALVVGGARASHDVLGSAELYDPNTGTFSATGSLATARYKHAAIALADGRVLVAGGSDDRDWKGKLATTELYDPATARFAAGPALTSPRFKLPQAAVALPDGAVLIAGGAASVERVRPGAASTRIAALGAAHYYATATVVADRLVVIGGYDDRVQARTDISILALR